MPSKTETKHTQEPWMLQEDLGNIKEYWIVNQHGCIIAGGADLEDGKRLIACVNNCEGLNPEAVPDMLAVCKLIVKSLVESEDEPSLVTIEEALRAVIARAERTSE